LALISQQQKQNKNFIFNETFSFSFVLNGFDSQ